MKVYTVIGRVYAYPEKVQIYVYSSFAQLLRAHTNKPCALIVLIPETDEELTVLEAAAARSRRREQQ